MSLGPWFKCYPGDFLQGMRDMEPVTQAFYVQLIFRMYETADAIYADERQIGRWCNSNARPWRKVRVELIQQGRLVELSDGGLINPRALEEMVEQAESKHVPDFIRQRLAKLWELFRESFGKDSRKRSETRRENPAKSTPLKEPEPEPEGSVESARDETPADKVRNACMRAAGLTEAELGPGTISPVAIRNLINTSANPADLDLDVVPAIQQCAATLAKRGQKITNWSYCHDAIIRNRDARLSGAPPVTQHQNRSGQGSGPAGDRFEAFDRVFGTGAQDASADDSRPDPARLLEDRNVIDLEALPDGRFAARGR